ncbi:hypothetical protein JMJ35_000289 [Cladonia borealis]|uniref:Fe2OG dioxygenase domain-containing protein n=1 Tax=Cladonia borealis TaxID=184061 RepID=A0AA39RB22_9LECA|nr:hypothetical protein JMJ35_000289 [Cladonia borealis]
MAISSSSGVDNGKFHDFLLQPTEITKVACQTLINMAESTTRGKWEEAMVNVGNGMERPIKEIRDCGRIIWDDFDMVATIWARIRDQVPEVLTLKDQQLITGYGPVRRNETWKMSRLNERMRFLKYQEGQYFKPHEDGSYVTPDGKEISFYTLHLYLNSNPGGGGATTFHSDFLDREVNVEPKPGRVLIFQHRGLLHSGADVTRGTKYTMRTDLMYKKVDE